MGEKKLIIIIIYHHICKISSTSNLLVKLAPLTTSVSPFHPSPPSLNSLIVPFVIPLLVFGTLCLLISDLSYIYHLQLPKPFSLFLSLNSLSYHLTPPLPLPIPSLSTGELCMSIHEEALQNIPISLVFQGLYKVLYLLFYLFTLEGNEAGLYVMNRCHCH